MSENTFEEMSDSFKDYKTNNFEDNELQTQLYAKIYYTSNNQDNSNTTDIPKTIQFDSICNELNIVPEGLSKSKSKHSRSKDVIGQSTHNDTLHVQKSINFHMSVEIQTNRNKSDEEANPIGVESNNTMNESYSVIKEKSSGKKRKSPNTKKHKKNLKKTLTNMVSLNNLYNETTYSKYNVRQKCEKLQMLSITQNDDKIQEISDDSDSEVSIVEIPVSPKPKPPLIDLQDSDEEDVRLVDKDDLHEACRKVKNTKVTLTNANLENKETSSSEVNKFLKNKNTSKSPRNKNTVNVGETTQTTTDTEEMREDIILNCSPVKKVASNTSEIEQFSKNTEIDENEKDTLVENVKHKKRMLQKKTKYSETNDNLSQDTHMSPSKRKLPTKKTQQDANINDREYNIGHTQDFLENMLIPFRDQHEAVELKRKSSNESDNNVKLKRQCTQRNDQNVTPQDNNDKKIRDGDKYFYDTTPSLELRDFCNSTRSQDSDISEAQRSMSKDPKMWKILDADLMPCPTTRPRKFLYNVRCSGCHQKGHQRIDCKASHNNRIPSCYMCGEKGHVESRCSSKMCLTCGKQQNTFRKTCECCRVLYCTMCDSVGHKTDTCPDLWRRYHQTTNMSDVPQDLDNMTLKPPHQLHCCNCTKRGHESSTCREYRWSQHFPTPAAVTDYTTGLMYEPEADNLSKCSRDNIILPLEEASSETLILPNITSIRQAPGKHSGLSTIVNPSSLSEEADHIPISQEGISQTENFKANEMCENVETKQLKYLASEKTFIDIIFSCGIFLQKHNKNAQAICHNLSKLVKSYHGEATITSLRFRQVSPTFLISLVKKQIPFEVKIGFITHQRKNVMLQIVTMEQHQKLLYDLLFHWINLPIEEKDYGIDATTLPRHPIKIFNILSSRIPQLKKMKFKSYNDVVKDPQKIFEAIKRETTKLQQKIRDPDPLGKKKRCKRQQKIVWRWQMRLLMIANTEPGQNKYIKQFQVEMKNLELRRHEMNEKLDIDIYLKLIYLYNMLFVPHTPADLDKMLIRFNERAKKQQLLAMQQQQQKSEKEINEQGNYALCTDVNLSFPPITPSTSQDINYVEDPSFDIQQNVGNNIENEREIVNNVSFIKNATIEDRFEIMSNNAMDAMQIPPPPPFITSFHTKSATNLPLDYFVPMSEQNPSVSYSMPQRSMWGTRRAKNSFANDNLGQSHPPKKNLYKQALELIKVTHEYQLPHLTNAAEELQRKVNNRMLQAKHINALKKLIKLEEKYQKNIDSYYTSLKT